MSSVSCFMGATFFFDAHIFLLVHLLPWLFVLLRLYKQASTGPCTEPEPKRPPPPPQKSLPSSPRIPSGDDVEEGKQPETQQRQLTMSPPGADSAARWKWKAWSSQGVKVFYHVFVWCFISASIFCLSEVLSFFDDTDTRTGHVWIHYGNLQFVVWRRRVASILRCSSTHRAVFLECNRSCSSYTSKHQIFIYFYFY